VGGSRTKVWTRVWSATRQTDIVESSNPDAMSEELGETAIHSTEWGRSSKVCRHTPVVKSQSLTVESWDPEVRNVESGDIAIQLTTLVC
jgi:hypothetical protein